PALQPRGAARRHLRPRATPPSSAEHRRGDARARGAVRIAPGAETRRKHSTMLTAMVGGGEGRWSWIAKCTVAIVWGLSGVAAALALPGTLKAGAALIPVALAFYRWPTVMRWPMVALLVLVPLRFLVLAHEFFHAQTSYPFLVWACVGLVAHGLLLFGSM